MSEYIGIGLFILFLILMHPIRKKLFFPLVWIYGVIVIGVSVLTVFWIVTKVIPKLFMNPDSGSVITAVAFLAACIWGVSSQCSPASLETLLKLHPRV